MTTPNIRKMIRKIVNKLRSNRLERLEDRLKWKRKEMDLKSVIQENSHSLLWIWEFSKKAVLICLMFYVIVQIYAMVVMVRYSDFSYLGDLINKTGEILENCVFAYFVKSGIENFGKIVFVGPKSDQEDDDDLNEPVG